MANAKQDVEPSGYDKAFDVFCTEIIDKRIIGNKKIMMLSYLNQRYTEYVRKFVDTTVTYQAIRLKKRIQSRYPQIVFHASKTMTKGTLVYYENITVGELADDLMEVERHSDTDDEDSQEACNAGMGMQIDQEEMAPQSFFHTALEIKESKNY